MRRRASRTIGNEGKEKMVIVFTLVGETDNAATFSISIGYGQ